MAISSLEPLTIPKLFWFHIFKISATVKSPVEIHGKRAPTLKRTDIIKPNLKITTLNIFIVQMAKMELTLFLYISMVSFGYAS